MVCLPFEFSFSNRETAADYVCESETESNSISKLTAIALGRCRMPAVSYNTVAFRVLAAGTSTLCISATVTKDVKGTTASDCSGTIAGTLLLFTFKKMASIVVNFDVDISCHLFTHSRFACAILISPHYIRSRGLFLQMRVPVDRHRESPQKCVSQPMTYTITINRDWPQYNFSMMSRLKIIYSHIGG